MALSTSVEGAESTTTVADPYAKTVDHMRALLQKKTSPMHKLLLMKENGDILSREIEEHERKKGNQTPQAMDQLQKFYVLRYVLIRCGVGDLYC